MRHNVAIAGLALALVMSPVRADDAQNIGDTVLPDLQFKGSTSGDAKASVALGFWFYEATPAVAPPDWHPTAWTLALEATAETKDGVGELLTGTSGEDSEFQAPVTWSLGASLGRMRSHSAEDLFGPGGVLMPTASTIASMNQAIRVCQATCTGAGSGCKNFTDFTAAVNVGALYEWAHNTFAAPPITVEGLRARFEQLLPGAQCFAARETLRDPAAAYVSASVNMASTSLTNLSTTFLKAVEACSGECRGQSTVDCQRVHTTQTMLRATGQVVAERTFPSPGDLCDAGRAIYTGRLRDVEAARYPRSKLAVGMSLGLTPHKYLAQRDGDDGQGLIVDVLDDNGMPTGETLPQLENVDKTYGRWKAGIAGAYMPLSGTTYEGRLLYEGLAVASPTSAQWCTVSGVVGDASASPKANACKTRPVGGPTRTHTILVDGYIGFADLRHGLYRIAIGPEYTFSRATVEDAVSTHTIGISIPFSLNLLAAPRNEQKLDYDGLVRVTPYYRATFEGDEDVIHSAGVTLELLGRRTLFSTKYDEL